MKSLHRAACSWVSVLLFAAAPTAQARGDETPRPPALPLRIRDIHLPGAPDAPAPDIYVDAHHATVLRFEEPMRPVEVHIPDWESRFEEPLASGRSVLIVPLIKLHEHERIPLFVTLRDGTRLPFSLISNSATPDQQVNVRLRTNSLLDLRFQLAMEQQQRIQCEQERSSPRHALAVLLSDERTERLFKMTHSEGLDSAGLNITAKLFTFENLSAVLFIMRVSDPGLPWILDKIEVTREASGEPRLFSFHSWPDPPNALGTRRIAVVMEASPKGNKEPTLLHLFERHGGRRFWYTSPKL